MGQPGGHPTEGTESSAAGVARRAPRNDKDEGPSEDVCVVAWER